MKMIINVCVFEILFKSYVKKKELKIYIYEIYTKTTPQWHFCIFCLSTFLAFYAASAYFIINQIL